METASFLSRSAVPISRPSPLLQTKKRGLLFAVCALENKDPNPNIKSISIGSGKKKKVPVSNYVVPLYTVTSASSCITRPLAEILRDLNKRVPDNTIKPQSNSLIPWYHANRMLSFYAPASICASSLAKHSSPKYIITGWCGEIRDVIFSDNARVTVVCRVTIRGSDGEAHRESSGTVSPDDGHIEDPVAAAEEIAFCRACARFGLGLYLYHEDKTL